MAWLPVVRDGRLVVDSTGESLAVDTPQWWDWLASATAFVVEHPAATFTVRREESGSRRGAGYWRAYHRVDGQRRRIYLGDSRRVTGQALAAAADALAARRSGAPAGRTPAAGRVGVPPPRRRILPRPRLSALLDQASRLPLTLVCAPAGYGKTTALASWAAGHGRVAWLSLDRDDNDPVALCRRLATALGAAPNDYQEVGSAPAFRRWLGWLLDDPPPDRGELTVVFDDYHRLGNPVIHDAVTHLVDHLPDRVRLVIAARQPPPLPLARWRVEGRLADVDAGQLRLTAPETAAFLTDVMGLPLAGPVAEDLHTRTEGWLAGLQLAGLAMRRGLSPGQAVNAARRDLDSYLLTEVLDRLPDATREFFLRTSVLSTLTGSLCDALTGRTDGARTLSELLEQDLFLVALDDDGQWYRYHQLFAAALAAHAERREPALLPAMHRRAARWHERYGDPHEAVEHALAARDHNAAARLMARIAEQHGGLWLAENRLVRWLVELPEPVVARNPVLCLLAAWAVMQLSLETAEPAPRLLASGGADRWLDRADPSLLVPHLRGIKLALVAFQRFLDGRADETVTAANAALELLPPAQVGLRVQAAFRLIDILCHGMPAALAARAEEELSRLNRSPHDPARRLEALLGLAVVRMLRGELRRAAVCCDHAAGLAAAHPVDPAEYVSATPVLHIELLLEWNRVAEAAESLTGLGDTPLRHPDPGMRLYCYRVTAEVRIAAGDEPGALRALDEMEDYRAAVPGLAASGFGAIVRRSGAARRAYALLAFGHPAAAGEWLDVARATALAGGVPPGLALYEALVAARLALAGQDPAVAAARADGSIDRFRDVIGAACQIRLRVVSALGRLATGDQERAIAALADALTLAGPGGFIRPFAEAGDALAPLLLALGQRAENRRLTVPRRHLQRVRQACAAAEPAPPAPALTAREREVLALLADGLSAPGIARRLGLAPATVRSHVERINAKLTARTQAHAVGRAYQLGLLGDRLPGDRVPGGGPNVPNIQESR